MWRQIKRLMQTNSQLMIDKKNLENKNENLPLRKITFYNSDLHFFYKCGFLDYLY